MQTYKALKRQNRRKATILFFTFQPFLQIVIGSNIGKFPESPDEMTLICKTIIIGHISQLVELLPLYLRK